MRRLAIGRRLVSAARRILTTAASCCCSPPSPCDKIFYKYVPCQLDPDFHVECPNLVRTTPVFMRCDVTCPGGCNTTVGTISPPGIKYKEWCHKVELAADGTSFQPYYDPSDPPQTIPPQAVPLPEGAEIVARPDFCITEPVAAVCGSSCCKCWRYYCGNNCPCTGTTGQQKCVRSSQSLFDERRTHKCLVGACAEFDSPIGFDDLPPGSEEVGAGGGTCCDQTKSGCADLNLCVDCSRTVGVYQWTSGGGCLGDVETAYEVPYDCCCSDLDTDIEFAYEAVKTVPETCGINRLSVARVRGFLAAGQTFGVATGNLHLEYWGNPAPPPDDFPITLQMTRTCAPASLLDFSVQGSDFFATGGHVVVTVQANCGVAVKTTSVSGCPEFGAGCDGIRSNEIRAVTFNNGGRSASCRAGCQERTSSGAQPRRKIPRPLELLG